MRAACLSLSAPSPARRPLRLALSALSPPSLSSATHLFTARRLALNKFAASTCLIPSRTAFTTCRRSMCCAAGLSFLASSRLFMQALTHHALFGARISNPFVNRRPIEPVGFDHLRGPLTLAHPFNRHQPNRLQRLVIQCPSISLHANLDQSQSPIVVSLSTYLPTSE